jgi:hypothetical protein
MSSPHQNSRVMPPSAFTRHMLANRYSAAEQNLFAFKPLFSQPLVV